MTVEDQAQARWEALVLQTAQLDGVPAILVREHRSDDHGRCAGCTLPQSGSQVWPCTLFALGVAATAARSGRLPRLAHPSPAASGRNGTIGAGE